MSGIMASALPIPLRPGGSLRFRPQRVYNRMTPELQFSLPGLNYLSGKMRSHRLHRV